MFMWLLVSVGFLSVFVHVFVHFVLSNNCSFSFANTFVLNFIFIWADPVMSSISIIMENTFSKSYCMTHFTITRMNNSTHHFTIAWVIIDISCFTATLVNTEISCFTATWVNAENSLDNLFHQFKNILSEWIMYKTF